MSDNLDKLRELTKTLNEKNKEIVKLKKAIDSSEVWERIYDRIPVAMCIAGNDTYFKKVNNKFCEILGYTKEEMLSKPYTFFVHPEDIESTYAEAGKLGAKKPTSGFINRYKTKSGEYIKLEWTSAVYSENNVIAIAIVVND
jgi:PAS domain S-box-containing protein